MNSSSQIKNPNFNADLKNMAKLVHMKQGDNSRRWERRPLRKFKGRYSQRRLLHLKFMPAITLKIYGLVLKAVVGNDDH